jgi:hypothetical protein
MVGLKEMTKGDVKKDIFHVGASSWIPVEVSLRFMVKVAEFARDGLGGVDLIENSTF